MRGRGRGRSRGLAARASAALLGGSSFVVPLALWCAVSYVPFVWHPMVRVTDPGDVDLDDDGRCWSNATRSTRRTREVAAQRRAARPSATRANPVFLPAPHEVARALVTGLHHAARAPRRAVAAREPLAQHHRSSSGASCCRRSSACRWASCAARCRRWRRLTEPFIEFFRYLPAPAFGALAVAVLGIDDAPKVAIIFIGTFFQQVLVIANTTRRIDPALLEAARDAGRLAARS